MAEQPALRTVVIENGTINKLFGAASLNAIMQKLAAAKKAPADPKCRPCQQRPPEFDYNWAKRIIAQLPDSEIAKIRAALQADRIKLIYNAPGNRRVEITR